MTLIFEVIKGEQQFRRKAKILRNESSGKQLYSFGVLDINVKFPTFIAQHKANLDNYVVFDKKDIDKYYSMRYAIIGEVD